MAWIESHQELAAHPKTIKLAAMLDIPKVQAVGHLHLLWWWALDYADDGDLSDFDAYDIAAAAEWEGDPDTFVKALIDCGPGRRAGFIDQTDRGLRIHDWGQHTEGLQVAKERSRKANHERWHARRGIREDSCSFCVESPGNPQPIHKESSRSPRGIPTGSSGNPPNQTDLTRPTQPDLPDRPAEDGGPPHLEPAFQSKILELEPRFKALRRRDRWPDFEHVLLDWVDLGPEKIAEAVDVFCQLSTAGYADTPRLLRVACEKVSTRTTGRVTDDPDWMKGFRL